LDNPVKKASKDYEALFFVHLLAVIPKFEVWIKRQKNSYYFLFYDYWCRQAISMNNEPKHDFARFHTRQAFGLHILFSKLFLFLSQLV